jgi:hypothetical protein
MAISISHKIEKTYDFICNNVAIYATCNIVANKQLIYETYKITSDGSLIAAYGDYSLPER